MSFGSHKRNPKASSGLARSTRLAAPMAAVRVLATDQPRVGIHVGHKRGKTTSPLLDWRDRGIRTDLLSASARAPNRCQIAKVLITEPADWEGQCGGSLRIGNP